jgi:BirA family biotin operon repressor/biotin-[acetyl-CoA-carboxylase] ligase
MSASVTSSVPFTAGSKTRWLGKSLHEFEVVESTNLLLRDLAMDGAPAGTVLLTHHQTGGRGRLGRTWVDIPGTNLLFSLLLRPSFPRERFPMLTFLAAVAVAEAIERQTGLSPECKWPNDILLNGRKCCGILLESSTDAQRRPFAVMGIGLNVNQREFPAAFAEQTTSLAIESGDTSDRATLFHQLLQSLESWLDGSAQGDFGAILNAWQSRARMFGRSITVTHGTNRRHATAIALAADGGLIVEADGVRSTVYAGDVTLSA